MLVKSLIDTLEGGDFRRSYQAAIGLVGNHLGQQFKAMEKGTDCDSWRKFVNQFAREDLGLNNEELATAFSISQEFSSRLWFSYCPTLGGDYVHIFFAHIAGFLAKYGGLGKYSNQGFDFFFSKDSFHSFHLFFLKSLFRVELNHKFESLCLDRKTSNGGGMQKGQKKGDKLSAPLPLGSLSNRKSQSLLQVLLTVKVLRHALLLQKILADYVLGATPSPYFNLCSYKKKTFELIASESHRKACQASYDRLKIFRLDVINGPAEHVFKMEPRTIRLSCSLSCRLPRKALSLDFSVPSLTRHRRMRWRTRSIFGLPILISRRMMMRNKICSVFSPQKHKKKNCFFYFFFQFTTAYVAKNSSSENWTFVGASSSVRTTWVPIEAASRSSSSIKSS